MVGDDIEVTGYITQDKFILGRTMSEIEAILGFHAGRLARGAVFAKLTVLPRRGEFQLAAYSITAQHRYKPLHGFDLEKLEQLAMGAWSLSGPNRLVKVRPVIDHDPLLPDDVQYPVGLGAPQWRLSKKLPGLVISVTRTLAEVYRPAF